jgi:hypothetical protein
MVYWAPILHFYQPPTQFASVLKRIRDESYRPLIAMLGEFEHARATININGSLTQMLLDCGHQDVVDGLRGLAESGRIEFLGSAMYHPILPLIPESEIARQIELNQVNLATQHRQILEERTAPGKPLEVVTASYEKDCRTPGGVAAVFRCHVHSTRSRLKTITGGRGYNAGMLMPSGVRKFALTTHVTSSVGWFGAVAAFLALAVVGVLSADAQTVRSAYLAMEPITWLVIVPLCVAASLTGVVQGLGTTWGLFRYRGRLRMLASAARSREPTWAGCNPRL